MNSIQLIFWQLFQLFLFFLLMALLAKLKLLPVILYLIGVNTIFPEWVASQPLAYYGIMILCLLYPAAYWLLKYRQHRQREAAATAELLAKARPLYGPDGYYRYPPKADSRTGSAGSGTSPPSEP